LTRIGQTDGKPRLLIIDAGGHGRSVAEAVLMAVEYTLVAFLDDGAFAQDAEVWGLPVMGSATGFVAYAARASHAVVVIGNNALRRKLCGQLPADGFTLARVVHPRAGVAPCKAG